MSLHANNIYRTLSLATYKCSPYFYNTFIIYNILNSSHKMLHKITTNTLTNLIKKAHHYLSIIIHQTIGLPSNEVSMLLLLGNNENISILCKISKISDLFYFCSCSMKQHACISKQM